MTDVDVQAKQMPTAPEPTPEDIERLRTVDRLEENDFLKVRLLNRNMELLETQAENIRLKQQQAMLVLQEFGNSVMQRYSLEDVSQVDPNTGAINRGAPNPPGAPDA